jgi:hypothetical protein
MIKALSAMRYLSFWEVLDQILQSLPRNMRTLSNLAEIAKNILACATAGERDPIELELAAWIDATITVAA